MAQQRFLAGDRASSLTYSEESGSAFLSHHIELDPHIAAVQQRREINEMATKASNPNGWRFDCRVPMPVLLDWLRRHRYTMHQWSINEGGRRDDGTDDFYRRDHGVKSKFMRYFKSREFSQLHTTHVTNKKGSAQVVVPARIARKALDLSYLKERTP